MIRRRRPVTVSGEEFVHVDANTVVSAIPAIYRPSAMIHNSFPAIADKFTTIPGAWGMTRAPFLGGNSGNAIDYTATGTNLAAGDAAMLTRAAAFFADSMVTVPMARGTLFIRFDTIQHRSITPSGNWTQIGALDTAPGGAYYQTAVAFFNYVFNTLGLKAAQFIGDTGVMIHCHNEVDSTTFWLGTPAEYKAMIHRIYDALQAVKPTAKLIVPTVQRYNGDIASEGTSAIRSLCDYFAANGMRYDGPDIHTFQGYEQPTCPRYDLYEAQAHVAASLAANNLPPVITVATEFQNNLFGSDNVDSRNDFTSAAYFASRLFEGRRAGFHGSCMAALPNLGGSIHPELFVQGTVDEPLSDWGMVVYAVTSRGWAQNFICSKPCIMLMRLFSLWDGGQEIASSRSVVTGSTSTGISVFAAKTTDSVFQLIAGWSRSGLTRRVRLSIAHPFGRTLSEVRIYRFNATTNNPKRVFDTSPGTPDERAALAVTAGDNVTYTSQATAPAWIDLEPRDSAFLQYIYA